MHPDADLAALLQRYAAGRYRPASFLERGAALPLTTPQLLGARVRPAERAGGAELVLPHPAGAEGVYVLPWSAVPDLCAPSLHDRALWSRVAALSALSPAAVREAARQVAAEGYAGRAAARAAGAAAAARRDGRARVAYDLLLLLLRQAEPPGTPLPPPERSLPADVQLRMRGVLKRQAGAVPPARALAALEEIAEVLEGCGLGPGAPLPRLADALGALAGEVAAWSTGQPEEARPGADLVAAAAALTLRCARAALAEAHALARDLPGLLARWHAGAAAPRAVAARPGWTLDGWDLVVGL